MPRKNAFLLAALVVCTAAIPTTAGDLFVELNNGSKVSFVGAINRWDMDGNHRMIFKGPCMYEHLVRVPLFVRPPGGGSGLSATSEALVVNVDLAPTLADFAHLL